MLALSALMTLITAVVPAGFRDSIEPYRGDETDPRTSAIIANCIYGEPDQREREANPTKYAFDRPDLQVNHIYEFGLPYRCLRIGFGFPKGREGPWSLFHFEIVGGAFNWIESDRALAIPTAPIWFGIARNLVFWFVVLSAPFLLIRSGRLISYLLWRRKRVCIDCRYDLRASDSKRCPECGSNQRINPLEHYAPRPALFTTLCFVVTTLGLMIPIVRCAIEDDAPIPAIHRAAYQNDVDLLRDVLAQGIDPNVEFNANVPIGSNLGIPLDATTPLMSAVMGNAPEAIEILIEAGADVDHPTGGVTPLFMAMLYEHVDAAMTLIKNGGDASGDVRFYSSPASLAVANHQIDLLRTMVEEGLDLRLIDARGLNLLHHIAPPPPHVEDDLQIVRMLIDAGCDVNRTNRRGYTPLSHVASLCRDGDSPCRDWTRRVASLLIEEGAEVNAFNKQQQGYAPTPLLTAAARGHAELVRLLIESGARIETPNARGWTPLIMAAVEGHPEVVRILLELGADADAKDHKGWTAIDHAQAREDRAGDEVLRILETHPDG